MAPASISSGISGSIPVFVRQVTEGGKRAIHLTKTCGRGPISAAINILGGQRVRPVVFILQQVLTPDNVNHLYPNDAL